MHKGFVLQVHSIIHTKHLLVKATNYSSGHFLIIKMSPNGFPKQTGSSYAFFYDFVCIQLFHLAASCHGREEEP